MICSESLHEIQVKDTPGTIVGRICLVSFLIKWANIGIFPDVGKRLLMNRCLEKQNKDRC